MPGHVNGTATEWFCQFKVISIDRFMVDSRYQRQVKPIATKIKDEFDPMLVGTLITSERKEGRKTVYSLIDGQQRYTGIVRGEHMKEIAALVYPGLTPQQEASIFAKLQRNRTGITTFERFRAELMAEEEKALGIQAIVNNTDGHFTLTEEKSSIAAIAALEWCYDRDPEKLGQVLNIIKGAWPEKPDQHDAGNILRGIFMFLRKWPDADQLKLIKKLSVKTPTSLQGQAASLREGRGGGGSNSASYVLDALIWTYNRS